MPFKFVNYSALSEANRQVSQEMKDLQATFDNLKQNLQKPQKQSSTVKTNDTQTATTGKAAA